MDIVSYSTYSEGNIRLLLNMSNITAPIDSTLADSLGKISGITSVNANNCTGEIKITYDECQVNGRKLIRLLGYLGN